jgi:hypothetical protein
MNKHLLAVALMSEGLLHIDMVRRTTSSIRIDDNLVLRPVGLDHAEELIEAFEETWPEVSRAMPWINPDPPNATGSLENQSMPFYHGWGRQNR